METHFIGRLQLQMDYTTGLPYNEERLRGGETIPLLLDSFHDTMKSVDKTNVTQYGYKSFTTSSVWPKSPVKIPIDSIYRIVIILGT